MEPRKVKTISLDWDEDIEQELARLARHVAEGRAREAAATVAMCRGGGFMIVRLPNSCRREELWTLAITPGL